MTLRLNRPFGQTIALATSIFALLLGAAEVFARSDIFRAPLTAPSMGTRHYEFGPKFAQLEMISKEEGKINCLILGSSMVDLGIDPEVIASTFKEQAGQEIRCFNFAIDALPAAGAAALAEILVTEYEPQLLIYGTDARDYAVRREAEDLTVILDSNWIRYRQGIFTLDGWLLQNSYLYRFRNHLPQLLRFDFEDTLRSNQRGRITKYGFTPVSKTGAQVTTPPDLNDDAYLLQYYFGLLSDYEMQSANLAGLERILDLSEPALKVAIVEMPVPETYFYFFGNGRQDYQVFIDRVSHLAATKNVPFWQSTPLRFIPDEGWVDYSHMNTKGARIFSAWLGQRLVEMFDSDTIANLETSAE